MGCCAISANQKPNNHRSKGKIEQQVKISTTVSQTESSVHATQDDDEEFFEYIQRLRAQYHFKSYQSLWFNSSQQIRLNYPYYLSSQCYEIKCKIVQMNFSKAPCLIFALIIPDNMLLDDNSVQKDTIFVYCKQKYPLADDDNHEIPVIIEISQNQKDDENGIFHFKANLNNLITMNMRLTVKK